MPSDFDAEAVIKVRVKQLAQSLKSLGATGIRTTPVSVDFRLNKIPFSVYFEMGMLRCELKSETEDELLKALQLLK